MPLLPHEDLDSDATAYRVFELGRDTSPWRVKDILAEGRFTRDPHLSELAWRLSSYGYYTEQAGLVAAAELAAETEDAALRFSLATAVADEARHADAFLTYAKAVGGRPDDCREALEPLSATLGSLPYLGKAVVHTMLEGFAADQFLLLGRLFHEDSLGELYRHVRADEIRHVAIGLNYLARQSRSPAHREQWREHAAEWLDTAVGTAGVGDLAEGFSALLGLDGTALEQWFLRRHRARLKAAALLQREGGDPL